MPNGFTVLIAELLMFAHYIPSCFERERLAPARVHMPGVCQIVKRLRAVLQDAFVTVYCARHSATQRFVTSVISVTRPDNN